MSISSITHPSEIINLICVHLVLLLPEGHINRIIQLVSYSLFLSLASFYLAQGIWHSSKLSSVSIVCFFFIVQSRYSIVKHSVVYPSTEGHLSCLSSVRSLSRVRLCDPMNRSTPGLPVHHQLPEFTQTHMHRSSQWCHPAISSYWQL